MEKLFVSKLCRATPETGTLRSLLEQATKAERKAGENILLMLEGKFVVAAEHFRPRCDEIGHSLICASPPAGQILV